MFYNWLILSEHMTNSSSFIFNCYLRIFTSFSCVYYVSLSDEFITIGLPISDMLLDFSSSIVSSRSPSYSSFSFYFSLRNCTYNDRILFWYIIHFWWYYRRMVSYSLRSRFIIYCMIANSSEYSRFIYSILYSRARCVELSVICWCM
jgi:hypothetical protein